VAPLPSGTVQAEQRPPQSGPAYFAQLAALLTALPIPQFELALGWLLAARAAGRRVYVIGNGGSAATASHLAGDLANTAQVPPHAPLRALALADNPAILTAIANDTDFAEVFARQLTALVEPGDVVIALSVSGRSPNILRGLAAARSAGARTIGLLGGDGGSARQLVDLALQVTSSNYGLVEDVHSAIGHALTAAIRAALLGQPTSACSGLPGA
jgi:D-sedoheptulose 7-phosphate isomerase